MTVRAQAVRAHTVGESRSLGYPRWSDWRRTEAGDSWSTRKLRDAEGVGESHQLPRMVCWHTVKRTTVKLPDDLDARLRHEAERRETTVSELTREAIEAHLGGRRSKRRLMAAGSGHSGHFDISERIEEILRAEVKR